MFEDLTPYALAKLADCGSPDSQSSPGARFLQRVAEDVAESLEDESTDLSEPTDVAHELADNAVPIYTHDVWSTFVDLAAYREDLADVGGTSGDMEQDAKVALYMIAERLALALIDEHASSAEDAS